MTTNNNQSADSGHYIVPDDDEETCYDLAGRSGSVYKARTKGATLFRRVHGKLHCYFNKDSEEKMNKTKKPTTKDEKPKKQTTKDEKPKKQTAKGEEETEGEETGEKTGEGLKETEAVAEMSETGNKVDLCFKGAGKVRCHPAIFFTLCLVQALRLDGKEAEAECINTLAEAYTDEMGGNDLWVKAEDITSLRRSKTLSPTKKKADEAGSALVNLLRNQDFRTGSTAVKNIGQFLDWCAENLIPYFDWIRTKSAEELQVSFDTEMTAFDTNSPTTLLVSKTKNYASMLVKTEAESMKIAFFVGKGVDCLRDKGAQTWNQVVDQIGMTKQTLHRYQSLYLFLSKYPRFLRVPICYTTLLKNAKMIEAKFKDDTALKCYWSALQDATTA